LNPDPQISQHGKNFIPFNDKNFYGDRERKIEREREREREKCIYNEDEPCLWKQARQKEKPYIEKTQIGSNDSRRLRRGFCWGCSLRHDGYRYISIRPTALVIKLLSGTEKFSTRRSIT
jgi:hypothetical protein